MRPARPVARHLRLSDVSVLRMLKIEEALFRADTSASYLLTNTYTTKTTHDDAAAVVLGISGKPKQMLHLERLRHTNLPVIKRFTGGGTVITDADTIFVSFITAAGALPHVAPYPQPILDWTSPIYKEALASCGCDDFRVQANDYCVGERKFGGNAQSISGQRWLHHTSLLWDYNPERMELLRMPPRQPEYRAERPHHAFVRALSNFLPSSDSFLNALVHAVSQRLELVPTTEDDVRAYLDAPHRKTTRLLERDELR